MSDYEIVKEKICDVELESGVRVRVYLVRHEMTARYVSGRIAKFVARHEYMTDADQPVQPEPDGRVVRIYNSRGEPIQATVVGDAIRLGSD